MSINYFYDPFGLTLPTQDLDVAEAEQSIVEQTSVKVAIIITPILILFSTSDKSLQFQANHTQYDSVLNIALTYLDSGVMPEDIFNQLILLSNVASRSSWSDGRLFVTRTQAKYNDQILPSNIGNYLISIYNLFLEQPDNLNKILTVWSLFINNIIQTQSVVFYETLFTFLQENDLRIDEQANIIAWKILSKDGMDKITGLIDNSVNNIITIKPEFVTTGTNKNLQIIGHPLYAYSFEGVKATASPNDVIALVKINIKDLYTLNFQEKEIATYRYEVIKHVGFWGSLEVNDQSDSEAILNNLYI